MIGLKIALMASVVLAGIGLTRSSLDELASVISLDGIPGPYSFNRFCKTDSQELWVVGGFGDVRHHSRSGARRKVNLTQADLNGVFFASDDTGWIVGDKGIIFNTTDRGRRWTRQTSPVAAQLQAITCIDAQRCWIVGDGATVLKTEDGGATWQAVKITSSEDLYAVSFINNLSGWIVGENGFVAHTINGGESWETQVVALTLFPGSRFSKPADLSAVRFVDDNRGWLGASAGIAKTIDGGRTWTVLSRNDIIGLITADGKTVWAVGRYGRNYITNDEGVTWVASNTKRPND